MRKNNQKKKAGTTAPGKNFTKVGNAPAAPPPLEDDINGPDKATLNYD